MFWPLMKNAITMSDRLKIAFFVLTTHGFTNGEKVKKFEKKWSQWLGVKYSLFVSSGSTANFLLVAAMIEKYGLKNGDKVIVPACTWVTNVSPIIQLGLTPIFCDVNTDNYSFEINHLKEISQKNSDIKMVFVTHLLGLPAQIEIYKEIVPNALFIEDVCESHGATLGRKKAGTFSEGSTFSFYFGHHMTTIEGGMVCTDDEELYELMLAKRSHGFARETSSDSFSYYQDIYSDIDPHFLFITDGYNFRNHEICAVLGLSQLKKLDLNIIKRRLNFERFLEILKKHDAYFIFPNPEGNSSFCFPILTREKKLKTRLIKNLHDYGIETRPIISGNLLRQPFLKDYTLGKEDSIAEIVHNNGFYIGNNQFLGENHFEKLDEVILMTINNIKKEKN
jgi:CDP-4-dehydro-6-deoxyglucose reductase, E1